MGPVLCSACVCDRVLAMFETPEKAERRLARDVELKDGQRVKRSRTDDVENSDPGAAASAASGAGAASKATAGHGTLAVAQQVEGSTSGSRRRPFRVSLFRVYLLVHDLTPGCYGCPCIRKGAKICGHSERCRERMEALLAQDAAGKARLEEAKRRLARYVELTDEQQTKRSRTDDVENSDPGAAASAASGAGAASKATAGHGT